MRSNPFVSCLRLCVCVHVRARVLSFFVVCVCVYTRARAYARARVCASGACKVELFQTFRVMSNRVFETIHFRDNMFILQLIKFSFVNSQYVCF